MAKWRLGGMWEIANMLRRHTPATEKQIRYILYLSGGRMKRSELEKLTRGQASELINKLKKERRK